MSTFAQRLKKAMDSAGIKSVELSEKTGLGKSLISQYLSGKFVPKQTNTYKLAKALNTTEAYLMGLEEQDNIESFDEVNFATFRVIGSIAAGYGAQAVEEYTGELEYLPYSMLRGRSPSDYFVLKVKGNSMYPMFLEGDKVLVLRCTSVDSGSIAVVIYDSSEATLKRVHYIYGEDWLELIPINPEYQTRRIENSDLEECRVLGKVVKLLRDI